MVLRCSTIKKWWLFGGFNPSEVLYHTYKTTGWWCNNHLEKYEFVNGKDYPIYYGTLVGGWPTPLKNMKVSWGLLFPIYGKIKHVWNHQHMVLLPSGNLLQKTMENQHHRNSEISHEKWWLSIGMLVYQRVCSTIKKWWSGWWYTYPSEKYDFVSWDDEIPNIWEK